jgi:hypothetical protein
LQAWKSDELQDNWELERLVDAGQGGSRTVRLRGAGGIVNNVVKHVLGDLMQPLPACGVEECCFDAVFSDNAALEVLSRLPLKLLFQPS